MDVLVLGGGRFVGFHLVQAALRRGHTVTTFTRGRHTRIWPAGVEALYGDRRDELGALRGRVWDAVIDTSGYRPEDVRRSTQALRDRVRTYAFVSTLDVYPDHSSVGLHEGCAVEASWDSGLDPRSPDGYRLMKAACEHEVAEAFPRTHAIFRSGLIVGPRDPTCRFSYWPLRVLGGGIVLAPAPPSTPVQFIDARDHAAFIIGVLENDVTGVFNVTSPPGAHSFESLLRGCARATRTSVTVFWIDPGLLVDQGVQPWSELPLWHGHGVDRSGRMLVSTARAAEAGLVCRDLTETLRDVVTAFDPGHLDRHERVLPPLRERLLLAIARDEGGIVRGDRYAAGAVG
jgi:2'-hydroxyisoflavone reductase